MHVAWNKGDFNYGCDVCGKGFNWEQGKSSRWGKMEPDKLSDCVYFCSDECAKEWTNKNPSQQHAGEVTPTGGVQRP